MLWDLVYWHALVKLRLHSQSTVLLLDAATSEVGRSVRRFRRVTDHIETYDLPQDDAAKAKKRRKKKQTDDQDPEVPTKKRVCKPAKLNLTMYKWHSISHYPEDVPYTGPLDLDSTQTVCPAFFLRKFRISHILGRERA